MKRSNLDLRWSNCVQSQQVYWKWSSDNPSFLQMRKLVIVWVIGKWRWSWLHCRRKNHQQRILTKVMINWQTFHWWRRDLQQRILTEVLMNWQIWNSKCSQFSGRIYISLRVSLKDLQDGLNLIVGLKKQYFLQLIQNSINIFWKNIEDQDTELYTTFIVPFYE